LWLIAGCGGNVVALATPEGLVLVDSGGPGAGAALAAQLGRLPGRGRVHTLFNTHWHLENTGANEHFGKPGVRLIAHEKTLLWLCTDHYLPDEDRYEKARPRAAWPTETFYTQGALAAGSEQIAYGYLLQAHTDGDLYVQFKNANVIAAGDAISPARDPQIDWYAGGWLGGRVDSLALLLQLGNEQTRYVPTYGAAIGRAQVQAEYDMLKGVFERMAELMRKGYRTEDMIGAGILQGTSWHWQDPRKFVHDAHKSMWAHHNTLSHDIV
jgi:glyoxylase-like metal-dependent hydrolase (beta-lactamase superfamily II)